VRRFFLASLPLPLLALSGPLAAARQKDPAAAGRDFALHVCGNCHVVEKGRIEPLLKDPAPSFSSIVARREVDEAWLRAFLSKPHANLGRAQKMPNPRLADFEIDEIVVYFQQLKRRNKRR
jgi:mono/diheme cytochrome c family protein